jgi:hypothetical protein
VRILLLWTFYDDYLTAFYAARPGLAGQAHAQQLRQLLDDGFGWPPAVGRRLAELDHEVEIVVANAEPLQRAWAREAGAEFPDSGWQVRLPVEQVRRFRPDVLWIGSNFRYFGPWLRSVREYCGSVVAWTAAPLPTGLDLAGIDCILTSHENFVREFRSRGVRCERVLPCFETAILGAPGDRPRDLPVSFVGSLSWAHMERIRAMNRVAQETPLEIWTAAPKVLSRSALRPAFWRARWAARDLIPRSHSEVFGRAMYEVMLRSRLAVNVHIGVAGGLAGNMRMFEATGCGALLLTERAPNLAELFAPGEEVVGYDGTDDLIAKIRHYLGQPGEAAEIAAAGQRRTLTEYTAEVRARELESVFLGLSRVA